MRKKRFEKNMTDLPWQFFKKIALAQALVTSLAIIATGFVATYYLRTYIIAQSKIQLAGSLKIIKESLSMTKLDPLTWCNSLTFDSHNRYTLINSKGVALCDSFVDWQKLENLSHHPEVIQAFQNNYGESLRYSHTLSKKMLFGAQAIEHNNQKYIIRKAISLEPIYKNIYKFDQSILTILLPLILITSLFILLKLLHAALPFRSIFKKIDVLKKLSPRDDNNFVLGQNRDWKLVEETLDHAKEDLENYIHELYYENEKFNTLIESISDAILAISKQNKVLFINKRYREYFLDDFAFDSKTSNYSFYSITKNDKVKDILEKALESETSLIKENIKLPVNKAGDGYFDLSINPLFDASKKMFGIVCIFHDVTSRRLNEKMREDFVANVSHEVKTPLTAMKGYVQYLKNNPRLSDQETLKSLEKIESNSNRLNVLFQDILNLSMIESRPQIKKEIVFTEEITNAVISNVRQSYLNKNICVITKFEVESIQANPLLIEQVLTNLIDNAYKYTNEPGRILISWENNHKNGCILKIEDDGIGIPSKDIPRLFERFYRVDTSRSRKLGGTGLGLAIVKHIVQKHGGKISVSSDEGLGTTFRAEFPNTPHHISLS